MWRDLALVTVELVELIGESLEAVLLGAEVPMPYRSRPAPPLTTRHTKRPSLSFSLVQVGIAVFGPGTLKGGNLTGPVVPADC